MHTRPAANLYVFCALAACAGAASIAACDYENAHATSAPGAAAEAASSTTSTEPREAEKIASALDDNYPGVPDVMRRRFLGKDVNMLLRKRPHLWKYEPGSGEVCSSQNGCEEYRYEEADAVFGQWENALAIQGNVVFCNYRIFHTRGIDAIDETSTVRELVGPASDPPTWIVNRTAQGNKLRYGGDGTWQTGIWKLKDAVLWVSASPKQAHRWDGQRAKPLPFFEDYLVRDFMMVLCDRVHEKLRSLCTPEAEAMKHDNEFEPPRR